MTEVNYWGTPKADVGEGYCPDCERHLPWHYENCPVHGRKVEQDMTSIDSIDLLHLRLEEITKDSQYYAGTTYRHENGSYTAVMYDFDSEGPADWENLAHVVRLDRVWGTDVAPKQDDPLALARLYVSYELLYGADDALTNLREYVAENEPDVLFLDTFTSRSGCYGIMYVTEEQRRVMGVHVENVEEVARAEIDKAWEPYWMDAVVGLINLVPGDRLTLDDGRVIGQQYEEESVYGVYPDSYPDLGWDAYRQSAEELAGSRVVGYEYGTVDLAEIVE